MTDVGATPMAEPNARTRAVTRVMGTRLARSMQGEGLRAKAMRGTGWTVVGFGSSQVLRLLSTVVLTRLLFPEAFGLLALAQIFMTGLQLFSDIGINPAIIRSARGNNPQYLNTAWTMQIIRGGFIWIAACLLSYPVSQFYDQPELFPILCVIGASAAIQGFKSTGFATANKGLRLRPIVLIELSTHLIGLFATIGWAILHPSPWALVAGGIVSAISSLILGHLVFQGHRHELRWERSAAHDLITFGKWILATSMLTFIGGQADRLMLGKLLSITDLGVYAIALTVASTFCGLLNKIVVQIGFPALSQAAAATPHLLPKRLYEARRPLEAVSFSVSLGMLLLGPALIDFLYDDRYSAAGPLVQIFAVWVALGPIASANVRAMWAVGQTRPDTIMQAVRSIFLVASLPVAFWVGGLELAVAGIAASYVIGYPMTLFYLAKLDMLDARKEIPAALVALAFTLLAIMYFF